MGYRVINGKLHFAADFPSFDKRDNVNLEKKAVSFKDTLNNEINKKQSFNISNHAVERLRERNINFSELDMKNINEAINKAEKKGCKESAILYKDTVLITSVKNRTIITAVDKDLNNGNVFTNIDSLVIL